MTGVSKTTVLRTLKKAGAKIQAMTPIHKIKRVEFSHWALREYRRAVTGHSVWGRLINTDIAMVDLKDEWRQLGYEVGRGVISPIPSHQIWFGLVPRPLKYTCKNSVI